MARPGGPVSPPLCPAMRARSVAPSGLRACGPRGAFAKARHKLPARQGSSGSGSGGPRWQAQARAKGPAAATREPTPHAGTGGGRTGARGRWRTPKPKGGYRPTRPLPEGGHSARERGPASRLLQSGRANRRTRGRAQARRTRPEARRRGRAPASARTAGILDRRHRRQTRSRICKNASRNQIWTNISRVSPAPWFTVIRIEPQDRRETNGGTPNTGGNRNSKLHLRVWKISAECR